MKGTDFLDGGGEMGALMRAHDWRSTALGEPASWPQSLRTSLRLLLNSGFPMYIFWGTEALCFYNDAYRQSLGPERHPASLGQPGREVWAETWSITGPLIAHVLGGGGATWHENEPVPLTRNGRHEVSYWTFSYGPLGDEAAPNGVGGVLVVCTETTAQVRGAQQLAESEARLQLALSAGRGIGTWDWDVVNDRVVADARFARLYGVDPVLAAAGAPIAEFFKAMHPDDLPRVQAAVDRAVRTGLPFVEEYRLVHANRNACWVLAEGRCELSPQGRPLRFPGVSFDITDRKISESRLRLLYTQLEQKVAERALSRGRTWQISPEILGVLNAQGYFEETNPAWQTVLGWSEAEVQAHVFFDFVHPDDIERSRKAWHAAVDDQQPALRFENRYRCSDGSYRWLSWVAVPDDDKVYCSARDVTLERAQADELAHRTVERDRAWQLSQDLLVVVNAQGVFTAVNAAAWTTALGWSESELVGHPFADFVHPDDIARTQLVFQDLERGPLVVPYEYRFRNKAGGWDFTAWTAAAFSDGYVYANGRVTTRERAQAESLRVAEEALRQAQKMEAVGQLTGGLAHDFNNLLTSVVGGLDMVRTRIQQGRIGDVEQYLATAQGAARRAAALTHRLLAFSRRQTLAPRPTDLRRLIDGMQELIQRSVGPAIEVVTRGDDDVWPSLIDAGQLENAILNLCINARDAMPDGGRIVIATANCDVDAETAARATLEPGAYVTVCVTDTGTGMSDDVIKQAFDPFFTTKPIGMGTGLGLSMIYGFARQSGGGVHIDSTQGSGTTVCIYLPRHVGEADGAEAPAGAPASARGAGETVLVVDDEESIRLLVTHLLGDLGYVSLQAQDGAGAMKLLQASRVDLLVTDVGLPGGMNGRQLADAARSLDPGLKVLFITGYAESAVVRDGQLEPGMHILTKPFAMETLAQRIRALLGA